MLILASGGQPHAAEPRFTDVPFPTAASKAPPPPVTPIARAAQSTDDSRQAGPVVTEAPNGLLTMELGGVAPPKIVSLRNGILMQFDGKVAFDVPALRRLHALTWATLRTSHGDTVLSMHGRAGRLAAVVANNKLVIGPPGALPRLDAAARSGAAGPGGAPPLAELEALRQRVAKQLAALNSLSEPDKSNTSGTPDTSGTSGTLGHGRRAPELGTGTSFATAANPPAGAASPRLPCAALPFAQWSGSKGFVDDDVRLRRAVAHTPEDLNAVAALAEFYVAHVMPNEALALLSGWPDDDPAAPGRARLLQVRDIARLMHGEAIEAASPLLRDAATCTPPALDIWQSLQAAALDDAGTVNTLGRRARTALTDIPEPMRTTFAREIADGSDNNPDTLKAMAASVRNSKGGTGEDVAERWLLQAQLARADHNGDDELLFLQHAVADGGGVPALFARARLAELQLPRVGALGAHAKKVLEDLTRTYRYDALGQETAVMLAHHALANGDFAGALDLADQASRADRRGGDGRAALLAARALRLLLVESKGLPLPSPMERISLFWRYEGYVTPGQGGDDIRLAATSLLLQQGFKDAALDVARQFASATLQTQTGLIARARSEALANTGDASEAIALLHNQPATPEIRRVKALALARLGRDIDAAHAVADLDTIADRREYAELLYKAGAWAQAAAAYAELLTDPALTPPAREAATRRYSLSVSLAEQTPPNAPAAALLAPDPLSTRLLAAATPPPPPPANAPPVSSVRTALDRAKTIETLLNP